MMDKRVLFFVIVVSMILTSGFFTVFNATQMPKIIINGEISSLSNDMILKDNRIYIPLAAAGSELEYSVKWIADKGEAVVTKHDEEYPSNMFRYSSSNLEGIQLFALNKSESNLSPDTPLSDFILSVDGVNKVFKWEGHNIDRQPEISLINDDNHIAIVTNTASGTGIHGQKLYVVDKKSLEEIPVNDAMDYFNSHVKFTSDNKHFTMTAGKSNWLLSYDYLDKSIVNERAKDEKNDKLNDLETYYKYLVERALKFQTYYVANNDWEC